MKPRLKPRNLEIERAGRALAALPEKSDLGGAARAIQRAVGFVSPRVFPLLANRLNVEESELAQLLAAEAPDIRLQAPGIHQIQICTGRTCARLGGARLLRAARQELEINCYQTTKNGTFRLEPFRCFGQCARAPNVRLKDRIQGAMTEKRFLLLLNMLRRTRS